MNSLPNTFCQSAGELIQSYSFNPMNIWMCFAYTKYSKNSEYTFRVDTKQLDMFRYSRNVESTIFEIYFFSIGISLFCWNVSRKWKCLKHNIEIKKNLCLNQISKFNNMSIFHTNPNDITLQSVVCLKYQPTQFKSTFIAKTELKFTQNRCSSIPHFRLFSDYITHFAFYRKWISFRCAEGNCGVF